MKITDIEMCEFYDVPHRTIADWKKTREKRYTAMKWALMHVKHIRHITEANKELYKPKKEK